MMNEKADTAHLRLHPLHWLLFQLLVFHRYLLTDNVILPPTMLATARGLDYELLAMAFEGSAPASVSSGTSQPVVINDANCTRHKVGLKMSTLPGLKKVFVVIDDAQNLTSHALGRYLLSPDDSASEEPSFVRCWPSGSVACSVLSKSRCAWLAALYLFRSTL